MPEVGVLLELLDVPPNDDDDICTHHQHSRGTRKGLRTEVDEDLERGDGGDDDLVGGGEVRGAGVEGRGAGGVRGGAGGGDVLLGVDRVEEEPGGDEGADEEEDGHERV